MQRFDPADPALTVQPAVAASAAGWEAPTELQVHDTAPNIDGYLAVIVDPSARGGFAILCHFA